MAKASIKIEHEESVCSDKRTTTVLVNGEENNPDNFSFGLLLNFTPEKGEEVKCECWITRGEDTKIIVCHNWKTAYVLWAWATQAARNNPLEVRDRFFGYVMTNKEKPLIALPLFPVD